MTTKPVFASLPKWTTTCLRFRPTAEISATTLPSWEGANNIRIWGTEDPHAAILHIRDSPKLNVTSTTRRGSVTLPPPRPRLPHQHLPQSWIGRTTAEDQALLRLPRRCVKGSCYGVHTRSTGATRTKHPCLL
jgi:hypothetical protein